MNILFIKMTSMGDLIHALPAITDAAQAIPGIQFDWVIDKNFSEIATWHPAVKNSIPTQHRKWRKQPWQAVKSGEIKQFIKSIRQNSYDLVIDGQTNFKSAFITWLSNKPSHGLDKHSAREFVAHLAYQNKYAIDKNLHAITRLRMLFAKIFQYNIPTDPPNYGIRHYDFPVLSFDLPKPFVYLVHNASWQSKLWSEEYWKQLMTLAAHDKMNVVLPWGNKEEKERAERLRQGHPNAMVLPFCTLSQHAKILLESQGAICSDTGLSHLAAALNVPAVTLYGPTSKNLAGTIGFHQKHKVPSFPCIECYQLKCRYGGKNQLKSHCLENIKPQDVWNTFKEIKLEPTQNR